MVPETLTLDLCGLLRVLAPDNAVELTSLSTGSYVEPTSGLEPLTCFYVFRRCQGLCNRQLRRESGSSAPTSFYPCRPEPDTLS